MQIRRDRLIIVDLEATCWKDNIAPPGQKQEIIEVGLVTLDLRLMRIFAKHAILVQPTESKVSAFCTKLTSITPAMVATGVSFAQACESVRVDYNAPAFAWGSWGDWDRHKLQEQCAQRGVTYPFSAYHINLKQLFADVHHRSQRPSLRRALELSGLAVEGTPHRGADDAWNTARVLVVLIERFGRQILAPVWEA